ncbi:MAG: hypothetical protein RR054_04680 [Clostridia bacterium]
MIELSKAIMQMESFKTFYNEVVEKRAFHSYIVESEDTLARNCFTKMMAMTIMCEKNGCGECPTCNKVKNKTHVDVLYFPMEGRKQISSKDDIAIFFDRYSFKALEGGNRVFVFDSVNSIRDDWQNKMLKALEETINNNYIIIQTDNSEKLLMTVKSRCSLIRLQSFELEMIKQILLDNEISEKLSQLASVVSNGNITTAMNYVTDKNYLIITDYVIETIKNCRSSKDCIEYINKLTAMRDNAMIMFNAFINVFHSAMEINILHYERKYYRSEDISVIAENYNATACAQIIEIVNEYKKKYELNVNFTALTEDLLLRIMEVKYKCRQ